MKDILTDRIAGALYGVAIGDALGAPLEFMSAKQIAQKYGYVTDMIGGGWLSVKPGETTDDTAMTLAVAEGIIENPDDPIPAIGERFIRWAESGPKDIGGTCIRSICRAAGFAEKAERKRPTESEWYRSAKLTSQENHDRSGGNGALMRAVYPALYYQSAMTAEYVTIWQGRMTHDAAESTEACQLYSNVINYLIIEAKSGRDSCDRQVEKIGEILEPTRYNMVAIAEKNSCGGLNPTGYVVDSLECAIFAFLRFSANFEEAVIYAANLGGDADTIAAICGGLAGAYYGFKEIPHRWVDALTKSDRQRLNAAVDAAVKNQRR